MGPSLNILLQRQGALTPRNITFLNSFLCVQKPCHCLSHVSFSAFFGPRYSKQTNVLARYCVLCTLGDCTKTSLLLPLLQGLALLGLHQCVADRQMAVLVSRISALQRLLHQRLLDQLLLQT
jgi:hypothetical protein